MLRCGEQVCGDGSRGGRNPSLRRAIFTEEHASTGHVPKIRKCPAWATGMLSLTAGRGPWAATVNRGSRERSILERRDGAPGVATDPSLPQRRREQETHRVMKRIASDLGPALRLALPGPNFANASSGPNMRKTGRVNQTPPLRPVFAG